MDLHDFSCKIFYVTNKIIKFKSIYICSRKVSIFTKIPVYVYDQLKAEVKRKFRGLI